MIMMCSLWSPHQGGTQVWRREWRVLYCPSACVCAAPGTGLGSPRTTQSTASGSQLIPRPPFRLPQRGKGTALPILKRQRRGIQETFSKTALWERHGKQLGQGPCVDVGTIFPSNTGLWKTSQKAHLRKILPNFSV